MTILARLPRPKPTLTAMPRAVLTATMIAILVATGGGAVATAQPATTPAAPTSSAAPQARQQAPAPLDPCAPTTTPTSTTTAPPTTTTAPPASCTTVPAAPAPATSSTASVAPAAPGPATTQNTAPTTTAPAAPAPVEPPDAIAPETAPEAADESPASDGTKIPYTGLPTENPNSTLVPGKMRSDREELPEGFTKEEADQAEIGEARLLAKQRTARLAVTCQRYWPTSFDVCGAIRDKYNSLGGPNSFLFLPTSGNIINPGGTGQRVTFVNGPIYWSAAGGAHPVVNSFLNRWGILGYEGSYLKYPTTDEIVLPDGGRRQEFQDGAIYVAFQNAIGSAIRNGPIRDKWNTVGGNTPGGSFLGYLTGDEIGLPDGQGRMARFQNGVIYWHPTTGAFPVTGDVLTVYANEGYEAGWGYPVSDQVAQGSNYSQQFQNGEIAVFSFLLEAPASSQGQLCVFQTLSDSVHIGRKPPTPLRASAHMWWKPVRNCPTGLTASITGQLQILSPDGQWIDRGDEKYAPNRPPGGGGGNWTPITTPCLGTEDTTWRVVTDVDLDGIVDGDLRRRSEGREIPCQ